MVKQNKIWAMHPSPLKIHFAKASSELALHSIATYIRTVRDRLRQIQQAYGKVKSIFSTEQYSTIQPGMKDEEKLNRGTGFLSLHKGRKFPTVSLISFHYIHLHSSP